MKRSLRRVTGKLYERISQHQRESAGSSGHPDQSPYIDKRTKENIWAAPSPHRQLPPRPITQKTKKRIREQRDKSTGYQHKSQCGPLVQISCKLEYLAGKDNNAKCGPMKI